MRILVTGAAGFIGSHTVDELLRRGQIVVGLDNLRTGSLRNLESARRSTRFSYVAGDVLDEGLLSRVLKKHRIDAAIHLAAMVSVAESVADPAENFRLNLAATDTLARAAMRHSCRRVVFSSSAAVYGMPAELPLTERSPCEPISPYGAAKLASEKLLEGYRHAFGQQSVCLRYFNVYGPRQSPDSEYAGVISRFHSRLLAGKALVVHGDGRQTRDFIYVGDVARINAGAVLARGLAANVYNVCTGRKTTIKGLAGALAGALGRKPRIVHGVARPADIRHSCGAPGALLRAGLIGEMTRLPEGLRRTCRTISR